MKLLCVIPYYFPKIGGLENYAYSINHELHRAYGWEIAVITTNHYQKSYTEESIDGIKVYRLPSQVKISNTPISLRWKQFFDTILTNEKPYLIIGHLPVPGIADFAARYATLKNLPFILVYQNDIEKQSVIGRWAVQTYYSVIGNRTLKLAYRIITTTDYYKQQTSRLYEFANKTSVVPPGIDEQLVRKRQKVKTMHKDPMKLLFVAQLDKTHSHKGLRILLQAMTKVLHKFPDARLTIVGEGDAKREYIQYAMSLNIKNQIRFLGRVSNDFLARVYLESSIIILPSLNNSEGFGMVLIEGGLFNCVGLATKVGGMPYVIEDSKTGTLVNPGDSNAIANAIIHLLKHPRLLDLMGKNAHRKALRLYRWKTQVARFNAILHSVL